MNKASMRDKIKRLEAQVASLTEENAIMMRCLNALTADLRADAEQVRKQWLS